MMVPDLMTAWVGLLLGLVYWGAGAALSRFFPSLAAAALLLALTVILTRALHLTAWRTPWTAWGVGALLRHAWPS